MKNLINSQKPSNRKRWLIKKDKNGKIKDIIIPYKPSKELKEKMITDKQLILEYERQKK
tara:strand:- start:333 stop:509 length:177 start_codon:yes stop_codon:yes gene_type:complete